MTKATWWPHLYLVEAQSCPPQEPPAILPPCLLPSLRMCASTPLGEVGGFDFGICSECSTCLVARGQGHRAGVSDPQPPMLHHSCHGRQVHLHVRMKGRFGSGGPVGEWTEPRAEAEAEGQPERPLRCQSAETSQRRDRVGGDRRGARGPSPGGARVSLTRSLEVWGPGRSTSVN